MSAGRAAEAVPVGRGVETLLGGANAADGNATAEVRGEA